MSDLLKAAEIINAAADELKRFNDMATPGRTISELIKSSRLDADDLAHIIEAVSLRIGMKDVPEFEDVAHDLDDVHNFFLDQIVKANKREYLASLKEHWREAQLKERST